MEHVVYWIGSLADWYFTKRIWLDRGGTEYNGFVRKLVEILPWNTEVELLLLKAAVYGGLLWSGAPPFVLYATGAMYAVAGYGNRQGWWAHIVRKIRS